MSREKNTTEEEICGTSLLDYLKANGHAVSTKKRKLNDRPDMFFQVDQLTVGCEIVQIPPGRVYKYLHSRFKQLEKNDFSTVRVVWPQEQHHWVKEVIESKTKKINAYKNNCGAERIWLLIHAPVNHKDTTVKFDKDEIMGLIKYAAKKTNHGFDEIYFWGPGKGITKIFPADGVWDTVEFNFEGGYPTDGFVMSIGKFKTTAHGDSPVLYDHGIVTPEVIIVPPQDPEFKKHKPRFKNTRYRMKILAGATNGQLTFEPVNE